MIRRGRRRVMEIGLVAVALMALLAGAPGALGAATSSNAAQDPVSVTQVSSHTVYLPYLSSSIETVVISDAARQIVTLTNAYRAEAGCPALTISPLLVQAAQRHSDDMAYNDFVSHTGSDGSTLGTRISLTGYLWTRLAENVAAGYPTPAAVVSAWMASDGHRANILNCALTEIGVGYTYLANDPGAVQYKHYWVQDFATPR